MKLGGMMVASVQTVGQLGRRTDITACVSNENDTRKRKSHSIFFSVCWSTMSEHLVLFFRMFSELSDVSWLFVTHFKMSGDGDVSEKASLMAVLFLGQVRFSQDWALGAMWVLWILRIYAFREAISIIMWRKSVLLPGLLWESNLI